MFGSIFDNFRLLVAEVRKQVEETRDCVQRHDLKQADRIHSRDDYIDTMKGILHNHAVRAMLEHPDMGKPQVDAIRAVEVATDNLENIGDFCTHIADQLHYLKHFRLLDEFAPDRYFQEILQTFDDIEPAVVGRESAPAFRICSSEYRLDSLYKKDFDRILQELESRGHVGDLITILFIVRYLERTGDALLNIGEAALSCILGEKFKIHQVNILDRAVLELEGMQTDPGMADAGEETPDHLQETHGLDRVEYHTIAETRSGCRIGRIRNTARRGRGNWTLYKEGAISKLVQEKRNLERWESIFPGLVPRIVKYDEHGGIANLLLEYIEGKTFQEILLDPEFEGLENVVDGLLDLLGRIWERTREPEPLPSGFMSQLRGRLHEILTLHPSFDNPSLGIGNFQIPSFSRRMARLESAESHLMAPFSVFIHGDFNNDNVIVNPANRQLRLIDVNRSRMGDYLQDVTVLLVSNFRLPIFDAHIRKRIRTANRRTFEFARDFARKNGDRTFDARCALGVCRSFLTSTRFITNEGFAREMHRRATYLADRLLECRDLECFQFPDSVLLE